MTRSKPRSSRPPTPPPRAFTKLTHSAAAAEAPARPQALSPATIALKLEPYQPKALTGADADAVLARNGIPPAKPPSPIAPRKTLREAFWGDVRIAQGACRWVGRKALKLWELFWEAVVRVTAYLLLGMLLALSGLVGILTIYELWTPAKTIAHAVAAEMVR